MRLAVLTSHPVQYYAPLFRELAQRVDTHVFFAHRATAAQQSAAGFGVAFDWDIDLTDGYGNEFLTNLARSPGTGSVNGYDTPQIGSRLRAGGFDALLVTGWHLRSYWQGIAAARRQGLAVLVRGDSQLETPRSRLRRTAKDLLYPALLRAFDAALYVGTRSKAYYRHYRYPDSRLFYSPHCVETARFSAGATDFAGLALRRELGIGNTDAVVLFAGKLTPFKRPLDVVDAVAQLRQGGRSIRVMVAGSGALDQELRARASSAGVPLHMLGFRNQSEMPQTYAAADVLVLPSTGRETWGLVCNEALASGTPIVVSDAVGCAPDLAADGSVGRVFEVGNILSCAHAIGDVLSAPPSRDALAKKSDSHSVGKAVDGILEALAMTSRNRMARR